MVINRNLAYSHVTTCKFCLYIRVIIKLSGTRFLTLHLTFKDHLLVWAFSGIAFDGLFCYWWFLDWRSVFYFHNGCLRIMCYCSNGIQNGNNYDSNSVWEMNMLIYVIFQCMKLYIWQGIYWMILTLILYNPRDITGEKDFN